LSAGGVHAHSQVLCTEYVLVVGHVGWWGMCQLYDMLVSVMMDIRFVDSPGQAIPKLFEDLG